MNILLAFDSFKGSFSSAAVSQLLTQHFKGHSIRIIPLGDGGEGTLESIKAALPRYTESFIQSLDPRLQPISVSYIQDQSRIYMESAHVIGLNLISEQERRPLNLSSYGIGKCIKDFTGVKNLTVTVGGSATIDGGLGMACALGYQFLDVNNNILSPYAPLC